MSIKKEKIPPAAVVELDSSDDDDDNPSAPPKNLPSRQSPAVDQRTLASRSFWKAGDYVVGPSKAPSLAKGQLEHARVHPKFLHSNATSHKWAFGAIAELLDNGVDEIQNGATFVSVDKIDLKKDNSPALLFRDDGGGMNPEGLRKCMSLGYSTKKSNTTIGQYGNGFKTSTMRLGADVIVLSRATRGSQATQSIGLLSYTFLRRTGQDDVIVPMIDFDISGNWVQPIIYSSLEDWSSNLKTILEWSPFGSKEDLLQQFEDIGAHGTKIIIYNLWLNDEGVYELSFDDDDEDIRLRDETNRGSLTKLNKKTADLLNHVSYRLRYSLRAYASILYLRKFTNFQVIIRGKPVQQYRIEDDLIHVKVATYRPQLATMSKEVSVETTIGFTKEAPDLPVSGFNVYHKNRLIRPFWKVTADGSSKGNGVIGFLEANFIEPAHDKQDFERSSLFIRLETKLKQMVMEYWKSHCHFVGYQPLIPSELKLHRERAGKASGGPTPINVDTGDGQHSPEEVVISNGNTEGMSVEEICEENIQLFRRYEEHVKKEDELKKTITNLEKELEFARRKKDQLAQYLETKRKQKAAEHNSAQTNA
ncbi:protein MICRORCHIDIA 2-like isoform X2 [Argentina anserina]|uniref:protein MICRORCHIDIA 2-like isoform X2 n=1 Tax=Argentina anserina TaxID=57926 RepID=UPI0021765669|nr:protein MICRORCHIDIA 2-like isoform X2 [Potentilla anserina]